MKISRLVRLVATSVAMLTMVLGVFAGSVSAGAITYSGQGITNGVLNSEVCGVENGAPVDGPYLFWVFTGGGKEGSNYAKIIFPWGADVMVQQGGGAFQYTSAWADPTSLIDAVSVDFDGNPVNSQFVISHGCAPKEVNQWCSPGYWKNNTTSWPIDPSTSYVSLFGDLNIKVKGTNQLYSDQTVSLLFVVQNPSIFGGPTTEMVADRLSLLHPDINYTGERYVVIDGVETHVCPLAGDGNQG